MKHIFLLHFGSIGNFGRMDNIGIFGIINNLGSNDNFGVNGVHQLIIKIKIKFI